MAISGVSPTVTVLHVCDYLDVQALWTQIRWLHGEVAKLLPGWKIVVFDSLGPFEDDDGSGAHFDGETKRRLKDEKLIKATRVDLFTSCLKVLRDVARHGPDFLYGEGQGAFVAAALRMPLVLETVLQARHVQRREAQSIAEAWGRIRAVWANRPRLGRASVGHELVGQACPALQGVRCRTCGRVRSLGSPRS